MTDHGELLRERWRAGTPTFGGWCSTGSPIAAEVLALSGFDWVCVDLQHGLAGLDGLAPTLQAISVAGAVPIARVPANEPWLVMRCLDLGAAGVIVPLVSSAAEAARAAAACRYPPEGARSAGPVRVSSPRRADTAYANSQVLCIVMVETRAGVASVDEICATPGVDGVYVGPRDLALGHGVEPGAELDGLVVRILSACRRRGVPAGIQARTGEAARRHAEAGFLFPAIASDRDLLGRRAREELGTARGSPPPQPSPADGLLRSAVTYAS